MTKMQKRKFDELISHFNRKVSEMSIEQKYKMELLGMISALGVAHEKELGTNLAEVGTDCISRQAAIDRILATGYADQIKDNLLLILRLLPPAQPEIIRCKDCKLNPKYEWFGCPMSHLSEKQRPETAWCWKAERRTDERSD